MGFTASSGRMTLTDASGTVKFDTDRGFFVPTNYITGSYGLSTRTATNNLSSGRSNVDVSTSYNLASVNSAADVVRGVFSVTASDNGGVSNLGWFNAGGTYVHLFETTVNEVNLFGGYTFVAESGWLRLYERVILCARNINPLVDPPGLTTTASLPGPTLTYRIYAGTFV